VSEQSQRIENIIAPSLEAMGYGIVRVMMFGEKRKTLQVMIERLDEHNVTIDDCVQASRTISALLDVEDPIADAYDLEVSSPGIDRPLVKLADFSRFAGYLARIECWEMIEGRKRFEGRIIQVDNNQDIVLESIDDADSTTYLIPFELIRKAKLLDEELLQNRKKPTRSKKR
jgi:ribosome maturation factor RimP